MGESNLDYDLQKTLQWCAANGVVFKVTTHGDTLAIAANRDNISAQYIIDEPFDAESIGNAMWAALFAVKHGTEYHSKFGHFPPVRERRAQPPVAKGESPGVHRPDAGAAPPLLPSSAVPRRSAVGGDGGVH